MPTKFVLALLLLLPLVATAQIYKWVDDKGQVHYSQEAPPDQQAQQVTPNTGGGLNDKAANEELEHLRDVFDTPGEKAAKERAEKKAEYAHKLKERCDKVQEALTQLQNNPGRRFLDSKGNAVRIPEDQRQHEMKQARDWLEKNCTATDQ